MGSQPDAGAALPRPLRCHCGRAERWPAATGRYYNKRSAAEDFIRTSHPHYGIFSLPPFLALRAKYKLTVIGQVSVSLAGGRQYYLISKSVADLAGCKGRRCRAITRTIRASSSA